MSTATKLATVADLEAHLGRCEIIDGVLIEMAPTGFEHGRSSARIVGLLTRWNERGAYEVLTCDPGFIWDAHTVRAPDVAVITADQADSAPARGYMSFAPLLVVEVVSPGEDWSAVQAKASGWLAFGVQQVWVVDPRTGSVDVWSGNDQVHRLRSDAILDGGSVLPGFSCPIARIFGGR